MRRRWALGIAAMAVIGLGASALAARMLAPRGPVFVEAAWDLPVDAWGPGRAFACTGEGCEGARLYTRTKSGFCNCYYGVADDTEIDRIGDVDLYGDDFAGDAPGSVTSLAGLAGRARLFAATSTLRTRHVLSIVVASDCKAVVATIVSDAPITPSAEASARAMLQTRPLQTWIAAQ